MEKLSLVRIRNALLFPQKNARFVTIESDNLWIVRGGHWPNNNVAGPLAFSYWVGTVHEFNGSRVVIYTSINLQSNKKEKTDNRRYPYLPLREKLKNRICSSSQ